MNKVIFKGKMTNVSDLLKDLQDVFGPKALVANVVADINIYPRTGKLIRAAYDVNQTSV